MESPEKEATVATPAAAKPAPKLPEMRCARDGNFYTEAEFVDFYGGLDEWHDAERTKRIAPFRRGPVTRPKLSEERVHHGVSCDRSGMNPIVGTRYHLPGTTGQSGSNLCQAEWDKLPPQEQATYERIGAEEMAAKLEEKRAEALARLAESTEQRKEEVKKEQRELYDRVLASVDFPDAGEDPMEAGVVPM